MRSLVREDLFMDSSRFFSTSLYERLLDDELLLLLLLLLLVAVVVALW